MRVEERDQATAAHVSNVGRIDVRRWPLPSPDLFNRRGRRARKTERVEVPADRQACNKGEVRQQLTFKIHEGRVAKNLQRAARVGCKPSSSVADKTYQYVLERQRMRLVERAIGNLVGALTTRYRRPNG